MPPASLSGQPLLRPSLDASRDQIGTFPRESLLPSSRARVRPRSFSAPALASTRGQIGRHGTDVATCPRESPGGRGPHVQVPGLLPSEAQAVPLPHATLAPVRLPRLPRGKVERSLGSARKDDPQRTFRPGSASQAVLRPLDRRASNALSYAPAARDKATQTFPRGSRGYSHPFGALKAIGAGG